MTGSAVLVSQATAQKPPAHAGINDELRRARRGGGRDRAARRQLDVEMLERAWVDAIPRRDAAIVNRIMADDFAGIDPVGNLFTKATYLPDLRNGVFTAKPIELDEIKTRIFGETAVVTSRIKIKGGLDLGSNDERLRQAARSVAMRGVARQRGPSRGLPRHGHVGRCARCLQSTSVVWGAAASRPVGQANDCVTCHAMNPHAGISHPDLR